MSEIFELEWIENVIAKREKITGSQEIFGEFTKVWVSGKLETDFEYSHSILGKNFYKTRIVVTRRSGTQDFIPVIIPEELMEENSLNKASRGKFVEVGGEFRSSNIRGTDGQYHLNTFVYARFINICKYKDSLNEAANTNLIYLDGYICKSPIFRRTPLGREITDLFVLVDRGSEKDNIRCIAWGRIAQQTSGLNVGERIRFYGRIQSRKYFKKISANSEEGEYREVQEVSIMSLERL